MNVSEIITERILKRLEAGEYLGNRPGMTPSPENVQEAIKAVSDVPGKDMVQTPVISQIKAIEGVNSPIETLATWKFKGQEITLVKSGEGLFLDDGKGRALIKTDNVQLAIEYIGYRIKEVYGKRTNGFSLEVKNGKLEKVY
jgi:hypothetical protein